MARDLGLYWIVTITSPGRNLFRPRLRALQSPPICSEMPMETRACFMKRLPKWILMGCLSGLAAAGCGSDDVLNLRLALPAITNLPRQVTIERSLVYDEPAEGPLLLDLYRPVGSAVAHPLVVLVHGGSWRSGSREDCAEFAWDLAAQGYATASIDYRLTSVFPAPVLDVLTAIDFLRARAAELEIDPDRIALVGISAGAHLALMAGLMPDLSLIDPARPAGRPYEVRAIADLEGPTDFTVDPSQIPADSVRRVERFLGVTAEEAGDLLRLASPISYVRPDGPPVLVIHGTEDTTVPIDQSRRLVAALSGVGQLQSSLEVPGMDHIGGALWFTPEAQSYRPHLLSFLAEHLLP
jgi:acetyl esterase/lipase